MDNRDQYDDTYQAFAAVYDRLMEDIPYKDWCDYVCGLLRDDGITDGLMLELGCGTGTLTEMFAERGYDMIGIDNSEEMLEEAVRKRDQIGSPTLYLHQDMRELDLYGTVRAAVSLCDTMNYLTGYPDLVTVLSLVNNYLDPGGLFIFDLKTDAFFRELGEQSFADADTEASYIWNNYYDEAAHINEYALTLFLLSEDDRLYRRFDELHIQRAFSPEEIRRAAAQAGMEFVAALDHDRQSADVNTKRMYIILREHGKEPLPPTRNGGSENNE